MLTYDKKNIPENIVNIILLWPWSSMSYLSERILLDTESVVLLNATLKILSPTNLLSSCRNNLHDINMDMSCSKSPLPESLLILFWFFITEKHNSVNTLSRFAVNYSSPLTNNLAQQLLPVVICRKTWWIKHNTTDRKQVENWQFIDVLWPRVRIALWTCAMHLCFKLKAILY
jgi:hypothetical protein